ncbi:MAG: hypothetical protein IT425_08245 [Pirellulales bacterium]|nr:hypothetical protein [Pirellulales bacterium]
MASNEDMSSTLNRLAGGLINAILGALILWVGQTTFRHAGVLAGVDEKIKGIEQQFIEVDKRQESMRKWLENVVTDMKDSTRAQFTAKDGDKLVSQVRVAEQFTADLERRMTARISELELKLATLSTQHQDSQEVAALKTEIAQLRSDWTRAAVAQEVQYQQQFQSADRFARGTSPVFLPPVDNRR